mmetsp:Transcript_151870/g.282993  ORF Transcript_151870/g.282993 Transcript_151870/m.282993 type:complete len:607 (+) Transcript_151870:106-1926(+)
MVVEACSVAMLALKAGNNQDMSPKGLHDKRIPDLHLAGPFVTAAAALGNASSGRTVSNGGGSFNHSQHSLSLNSPPPLKLSMNFTMTPPKSKSAKELMLCPSAAPTPRKPSFSGNFQVRPAQIWAPSAGTANDFARVRNGGKSLLTKQMVGLPASDLLRVSSAPILASAVNNAVSSSPKTPRAARGMVRKVSKVLCNYPEVNFLTMAAQQKPPTPPSGEMAYRPASSARSFSEPPSGPKRHTKKRVSFADQVPEELQHISTSVSPQGSQTRALKKSMRLLDALHDLRRVDKDEEEAAAAAAAAGVPIAREPEEEEEEGGEQGALLHQTLAELCDNFASLRALEIQLNEATIQVCANGGARHATTLLSSRTLQVVRRKAALLEKVEERHAAFEACHSKCDELVPQLMADEIEIPEDLLGITKFISKYTHKGGDPVDADRSDFKAFVSSFKLPWSHRELTSFRDSSERISQWWAEAALRVAQEGADYSQIRRMFTVAIGAGADDDHPYLLRATGILHDRLADKVLKDAQDMQKRDADMAARSEIPPVGPASRMADAISASIVHTTSQGVPEHDRRIVECKKIMKDLRQADGERKRLAARQKRLAGRGG